MGPMGSKRLRRIERPKKGLTNGLKAYDLLGLHTPTATLTPEPPLAQDFKIDPD